MRAIGWARPGAVFLIVGGMSEAHDAKLSAELSARCAEARETLLRHMTQFGLLASDGWRISESTRAALGATEIVMRPVHRTRESPPGLECVVRISEESRIESRCTLGL
jgi:hypothetical protein